MTPPFIRHLFANHPTSGKLTLVSIHPERTKRGHTLLETKCECGNTRIVEASSYKRGEARACKECARASHFGNARRAALAKLGELARTRKTNARVEQAEALLARCIAAHQRQGIEFDYDELRREIWQEVAQYDFSDLLTDAPITLDITRPSSLALAEGGSGL